MSFTWSWSALEAFEHCPRKFYDQYVLKTKYPPNAHLLKGREVHKEHEDYMNGKTDAAPTKLAASVRAAAAGKKRGVELKLGLNGQLEPCGFFDDGVWARCALDVILYQYPIATVVDWKTGKVAEEGKYWKGPSQLMIQALFTFKAYPKIEKVTACNAYVEHDKIGSPYVFERKDEARYWAELMPRIQRMEQAVAANQFCMMPGPLCGYCPVKTCPNNRS